MKLIFTVLLFIIIIEGELKCEAATNELFGKFLHVTGNDPNQLCHRLNDTNPEANTAGEYGTLLSRCDTPYALSNETMSYLQNNFKNVDFIIYTGDFVRHDRDKSIPRTRDQIIFGHEIIVKYFTDIYDPDKIKFFPTLGNNDEFEHDQLPPGPNDLFPAVKNAWAPLKLNITDDFLIGGYYRHDINSNLSVISLNSMYFYPENLQSPDCSVSNSPGEIQLKWFENELENAKHDNRKVYILLHIPPINVTGYSQYNESCYNSYVDLLGRYYDVIYGHFSGHTNEDNTAFLIPNSPSGYKLIGLGDPQTLQSPDNYKNILMALYNAPSILPALNPAFREFTYSTSPIDFGKLQSWTQYYSDLTKANNEGKVTWEIEYTTESAYNMKGLDANDWVQVLTNFSLPDSNTWKLYKYFIFASTNVSGSYYNFLNNLNH
ncbi:Metallo-dependent phosphatase-like protein [Gigaspora rosea]|uniref:Metallo-dependent phosphatase-like protein n=1 Tax=Gigaspora rosea TaxID=44941 RepID=A0A397W9B2_9GLOM|nr:Metallo-dependent phosphatase-like protein [Gigaspora rosea]